MDYNNDGYVDLLAGDRDGKSWLFTGSASGLEIGVELEGDTYIRTGYNASPFLVDWDEDGYLDLLVGGYPTNGGSTDGFLWLFMNEDTNPNELNFTTHTELPFWNKYRTTHHVYDLDRDGDKDLILGNEDGKIYFAPNTGTNEAPVFSSYTPLEANGAVIDVGSRAREFIDDWNEDGIPDLIVCDTNEDNVEVFLGGNVSIEDDQSPIEISNLDFFVSGSPTTGSFAINIQVPAATTANISLIDCQGRIVDSFDWSLPAGSSVMNRNINSNAPGIYFVSADFGDKVVSEKVVLVR